MDAQGFDRWAETYRASVRASDAHQTYPFAGYAQVLEAVHDAVCASGTGRLLDLGCGTGTLTQRLYGKGYAVTGLDFSPSMLALAREAMPDATLLEHDFARGLPETVLDCRYRAVISTYALHHLALDSQIELLETLYGLLEPGGVLAVGDIAFETPEAQAAFRANCAEDWDGEETYLNFSQARQLLGLPALYVQLSVFAGVLLIRKPGLGQAL